MWSKLMPCSARARMRRAISTHSRFSPGAEKSRWGSGGAAGGCCGEKSQKRTRSSGPSGVFSSRPFGNATNSGFHGAWLPAGSLPRSKIVQLFRSMRRVHNARSNRFDSKTADGSKRGASHGLRSGIGSELNQSHGVDALRTFRESGNDKFVGSGASGSDEKNFRAFDVFRKEGTGALDQPRVSSGVDKRTRSHKQLYLTGVCSEPWPATRA